MKQARHEGDVQRNFGVTLIPRKDATFNLVTGDALVALAEDET